MSTELTSPVHLYTNGPMTVAVGYSYDEAVQHYCDVQNQALEVAAVKLVEAGIYPVSPRLVRSLKHRPKPDPQLPDVQVVLDEMKALFSRLQAAMDAGRASP